MVTNRFAVNNNKNLYIYLYICMFLLLFEPHRIYPADYTIQSLKLVSLL